MCFLSSEMIYVIDDTFQFSGKLIIAALPCHCWFKDFVPAFQDLIKEPGWDPDQG